MPELPEVETVRMGLRPVLEGHTIIHAETRRPDLRIPFPKDFACRLTGRRVRRLTRRAKYLLAELDDGQTLVMHLGMSGRMSVYTEGRERRLGRYVYDAAPADAGLGKHDHVVLETDAPARIVFTDHRRFGLMTLLETDKLDGDPLFEGLGIEPLSPNFDAAYLTAALKGKKTSIKSALLDQRLIAGIGNIYDCESLWRARISPRRRAARLTQQQIRALVPAIKDVLSEAVKVGGSSLRDHKRVDGELGEFQHYFAAYDRENKLCPRQDGGRIKRIVQSGRSTFFCPRCQR